MINLITFATLLASGFCTLILYPYIAKWKIRQALLKLSGPKFSNFFLGNLENLPPRHERFKFFLENAVKYEKQGAYGMLLGPIPRLNLTSLTLVREILTSNTLATQKSSFYYYLSPWIGEGLLLAFGEKWKKMRRLTTPAFHFEVLQRFLVVMNEQADILVERLKAQEGKEVDIFLYITACALDIICETAMGKKVNAQSVEGHTPYVDSIYTISALFSARIENPLLLSDFIYQLTPAGRKWYRTIKTSHDFTKQVIKERRELLLAHASSSAELGNEFRSKPAFLDTLLKAQMEGEDITDENIREEVDTFMFEGHDTSSASMAWTVQLLGLYPDVQETLFQEISQVVGNSKEVDQEMISQMKYLEMVLKESLRIYPSVPSMSRVLTEDFVVNGVTIPKGTDVGINIQILHHHPSYWKEPEKFDPERWTPENSEGRDPYQYIPFSAGSRNCIGQKFAMNEEKVVLCKLVQNFKIQSVEREPKMDPQIILRPKHGIKVILTCR